MLNEPNYHLTDSNGNIVGTIGTDTNGDVIIEHASSGAQVEFTANGISIPNGHVIKDGNGTERLNFNGDETILRNEDGDPVLFADGSSKTDLNAFSDQPVGIFDLQGSFKALQYTASSSAPGTLELTNTFHKYPNIPDGSGVKTREATHTARAYSEELQRTDGVSTSFTTIWDNASTDMGWAYIVGTRRTNQSVRFIDKVLFSNRGNVTAVETEEANSPATRSYRTNGSSIIQLQMGSDTYDIMLKGSSLRTTT